MPGFFLVSNCRHQIHQIGSITSMHVRGCNWNQKLINSSVAAILFSTVIQMDHIIKELVCHGTCKKEEEN